MKVAAWLLRLYPRSWRDRYGDEFLALLEDMDVSPRVILDVVFAATRARLTGVLRAPRRRLVSGPSGGGDSLLLRTFVVLAAVALTAAVVLYFLHSFAYLLVAILAVVLALAAGAAKLIEAGRARPH